ncbi:MAG: alcohol dehydrogenase catalytic domain-containing protein [Spirochaetales bacterium]|nr:alcohol dehydrogenase catalytic domain-containing protein [Spirochaetales bacterium]
MATETMKALRMYADWDPKPGFKLGAKDIEGRQTYLSSQVWRNPQLKLEDVAVPQPKDNEVVIQIRACGICGTDVHMYQTDDDGYMFYPGLTGFPATIGHELSGVVAAAGPKALNKGTNRPFSLGEKVCAEEMIWCGSCKPCADGYPNHCERLDEIGINVDGGFTKYVVVPDRVVWSLDPLSERYTEQEVFQLGALIEPTCVAYNAVIERGGGVHPGDNVVILGAGPVGLLAAAILKRNGAGTVVLSEPSEDRARLAPKMGVDHVINPMTESMPERVLQLTKGMGASLFLEATGLPTQVYPDIEQVIWEGRTLNSTVVVVARADAKIPVTGEVLQVRRARIVGAQGHSGHGTFPRAIESIAKGMDVRPVITKTVDLDGVQAMIEELQTDKTQCKVQCLMEA